MSELTNEEKYVLDEYINEIKSNSPFITVDDCRHRIMYSRNGENADFGLLIANIDYVLNQGNFNEVELVRLSNIVKKKHGVVRKIKDVSELNWDRIIYDGDGYVIMDNGVRYEIE